MNVLSCTKSQWRVMNILSCTKSHWKSIECFFLQAHGHSYAAKLEPSTSQDEAKSPSKKTKTGK